MAHNDSNGRLVSRGFAQLTFLSCTVFVSSEVEQRIGGLAVLAPRPIADTSYGASSACVSREAERRASLQAATSTSLVLRC